MGKNEVVIASLAALAIIEAVIIWILLKVRGNFERKLKKTVRNNKALKRRNNSLSNKIEILELELLRAKREIQSLYDKIDETEEKVVEMKQKAMEYAEAMNNVVELYEHTCSVITDYVREGALVRGFGSITGRDAEKCYMNYKASMRDFINRGVIRVYNFKEMIEDAVQMKELFGTDEPTFLGSIFN